MDYTLSGCENCLLFNDGQKFEYDHSCKHPKAPKGHEMYDDANHIKLSRRKKTASWGTYNQVFPITPDWCPLKKEPLNLIFKEPENEQWAYM